MSATVVRFNDVVRLDLKRVVDQNGFAHVPSVITRVGVQEYRESQLGLGLKSDKLVKVFRPPETVFHADTIESFKHLPVTDGHPPEGVSPRNAKIVQGGHIGEDVAKMDDFSLGATLHLTDESFIHRSKGSETSAGYDARIVKAEGVHDGEAYQYKFDGAMVGNHLALVDSARCGNDCRVLDENKPKENDMEAHEVQKLIDEAITKNNETLNASTATIVADALTSHQDALDKKAEEAQQKLDDEAAKKDTKEAQEARDKKIADEAVASTLLRTKLKPLLADKFDDEKSDKELLVLCFADRVEGADTKSTDYLTAMLDQELEAREKGGAPLTDGITHATAGAVSVKAIV